MVASTDAYGYLNALVAISVLGDVVGLIIHYALDPVVEAAASSDVMPRPD